MGMTTNNILKALDVYRRKCVNAWNVILLLWIFLYLLKDTEAKGKLIGAFKFFSFELIFFPED